MMRGFNALLIAGFGTLVCGARTLALTEAASPAQPCTTPETMPPDFPPYDGTPFHAVGKLHHANGPNHETTGFRIDEPYLGDGVSAEIDMVTVLQLSPVALYRCGVILDRRADHDHVLVADGVVASACGDFIQRRKIVVARHLIDLMPDAAVATDWDCAALAMRAAGGGRP